MSRRSILDGNTPAWNRAHLRCEGWFPDGIPGLNGAGTVPGPIEISGAFMGPMTRF